MAIHSYAKTIQFDGRVALRSIEVANFTPKQIQVDLGWQSKEQFRKHTYVQFWYHGDETYARIPDTAHWFRVHSTSQTDLKDFVKKWTEGYYVNILMMAGDEHPQIPRT